MLDCGIVPLRLEVTLQYGSVSLSLGNVGRLCYLPLPPDVMLYYGIVPHPLHVM